MENLSKYIRWYILFGSLTYLVLYLIGNLLYPFPPTYIFSAHVLRSEHLTQIILFSAVWVAVMLTIYFLLALRVKKVNRKEIFLHMGVIAMLGPICEVLINTFCRLVWGGPLWVYHFLPVHHGDTSIYSFFVWGMYGCHLYFMDKRFIHSTAAYRAVLFALILSVDAIILEFILNTTSIYFLHTYIFFYFPNDVHHLTTLAVVPFYFCGGLLTAEILKRTFNYPALFGFLGFLTGFVFTFSFKLIP